jgi:hypothetical protein
MSTSVLTEYNTFVPYTFSSFNVFRDHKFLVYLALYYCFVGQLSYALYYCFVGQLSYLASLTDSGKTMDAMTMNLIMEIEIQKA